MLRSTLPSITTVPRQGDFAQSSLQTPERARSVRWPLAGSSRLPTGRPTEQDAAFIALLCAYRPRGGLARQRCHLDAADPPSQGTAASFGCLIDEGAVFAFRWHDALWMPLFQIEPGRPGAAVGPQRVVAELGVGFDGWALAHWFIRPNSCLAGETPVDCLQTRLPLVLQAAREDRFVSNG